MNYKLRKWFHKLFKLEKNKSRGLVLNNKMKNKLKIIAIVQARMGSTRLPGKMMMRINGKPMVFYIPEQLKYSKLIDEVIIATSVQPENDEMYNYLKSSGVEVFRGPEDDVLKRFVLVVEKYKPDIIVRITGDEPLIDPFLVDKVIKEHLKSGADYTSTKEYKDGKYIRTVPMGLDSEVFSAKGLLRIDKIAKTEFDREHVTPYFYMHPKEFKVHVYKNKPDYKGEPVLTVDNQEDFDFVKGIIEHLYTPKKPITLKQVVAFIKKNLR